MSDWSTFTDDEIREIKHTLNVEIERAMIVVLLISPILCAIAPYFPGRRGRRLIDRMNYLDAVFAFSLMWVILLIGIWFWHNYKTNKEFAENRSFLRKKQVGTSVKLKSKSIISTYEDIMVTDLQDTLETIKLSKEESLNLKIGDEIIVEYEEQTKTVLKLEKLD